MSLLSLHTIAATVTGVTGPIYKQNFDAGTVDSWITSDAVNTSASLSSSTGVTSSPYSLYLVTTATAPKSTYYLRRVLTGLVVGRTYTFSANVTGYGVSFGVLGIGSTTISYSATPVLRSYSFTATATSHTLNVGATTTLVGAYDWLNLDDVLVTQPNYPLDIKESQLTLDDSWSPYAQGELICFAPSISDRALIDPKLGLRVSVTATESFGSGTEWNSSARSAVTRTFDLALRSRVVNANTGEMTLTLASDERLLQDWVKLDTTTENVFGLDVATAVAYALNKIGATLQPGYSTATLTPTLPAISTLPNLLQNPSCAANITGLVANAAGGAGTAAWQNTAGQDGTTGWFRLTMTTASTAGVGNFWIANETALAPAAGHTYLMTGWLRTNAARTFYPRAYFFATTGGGSAGDLRGTPIAVAANTWTFFSITGVAPPTAASASLFFESDAAMPVGATFDVDNMSVQDVSSYSYVNQMTNPSATSSLGTWVPGGSNGTTTRQTGLTGGPVAGVTTYVHTAWTGNSGSGLGGVYSPSATAQGMVATPSQQWTYGAWYRSNVNMSVSLNLECNGGTNITGTPQQLVAGVWTWLTQTFTTTASTTAVGPYTYAAPGSQWVSGNTLDMLGMVMTPGSSVQPSFDGNTSADGLFTYTQQGTYGAQFASAVKTYVPTNAGTAWTPGTSAWDYVAPLVQAGGLRLFCDESRKWYLVNSVMLPGTILLSSATGLEEATDQIDLSDDTDYFTGAVIQYSWTDSAGLSHTAYDYAGTQGKVYVQQYSDTVYPGPGAAAAILARAAGKGHVFDVTAESNYSTTPGMQLAISLPDGTAQVGAVSSVTWQFPDARMSVGSKGLTDTPANAWILALGSWSAATGTWAGATGTN